MDRDSVFRRHVLKHAAEPVVGDGRDQVGHDAELGAAERRGDGVAAKGYRVGGGHMFFVAGRHVVGDEGNVDIGLSDEESLHSFSVMSLRVIPARRRYISTGYRMHSLKLFANPAVFAACDASMRRIRPSHGVLTNPRLTGV